MAKKIIISGGGTGGHIFPAISIANAMKKQLPDADILFVGAQGRMEMEKVPAAGYPIVGLPVSGFDRKNMLRNVRVLINLLRSMMKARRVIRNFKPDIAIGVGGYASAPVLRAASSMGIPTLIQEQNSYAGVTNKLLSRRAQRICVAYEGMQKFFPAEKIILTGNPVRQDLLAIAPREKAAYEFFGFSPERKTILIVGGSLGARTINQSIAEGIEVLLNAGVQILWQTGKSYIGQAKALSERLANPSLLVTDFVTRMDYAYSIADLVVSRAGASSISELSLLAKPVVLVPSPNVAEDHQTQNALALVRKNAAVLVKDLESMELLVKTTAELIANDKQLAELSQNIFGLAQQNSAERIAHEVMTLIK